EDIEYALDRNTYEFLAAHGNSDVLAQTVRQEGGYVRDLGDNYVTAVTSPETAMKIGQRLADEHGHARVFWQSNLSKAKTPMFWVTGKVSADLGEKLKAAGFTHIYDTPTGHAVMGKGRVKWGAAEQAIKDAGLSIERSGKFQQEVFDGAGQEAAGDVLRGP